MKAFFLLMLLTVTWSCRAESEIVVDRTSDGMIHVRAEVLSPAPADVVWQTLTDYDHLAMFIPDMVSSRVVSMPGEPIRVAQKGSTSFLMFSFPIDVVFVIEPVAAHELRFHAIEGNLQDMTGKYRLEPGNPGTRIHYETRFKPVFWVPPLVSEGIMQREIKHQFDGLVEETVRRITRSDLQKH